VKITEVAQTVGILFSTVTDMYTFLTKNELGYIWGDFFKNASGHPADRTEAARASNPPLEQKT
jgi:hypothetical protein